MTQAVLFNSCMMRPRHGKHGSTDDAADAVSPQLTFDETCAIATKETKLKKNGAIHFTRIRPNIYSVHSIIT